MWTRETGVKWYFKEIASAILINGLWFEFKVELEETEPTMESDSLVASLAKKMRKDGRLLHASTIGPCKAQILLHSYSDSSNPTILDLSCDLHFSEQFGFVIWILS